MTESLAERIAWALAQELEDSHLSESERERLVADVEQAGMVADDTAYPADGTVTERYIYIVFEM